MDDMRDRALREHVGMEIKVAMLRAGVSQAEFARVLGCSPTTLSAKLTGKIAFTTDDLWPICEQLGLDIADLFPSEPHRERVDA